MFPTQAWPLPVSFWSQYRFETKRPGRNPTRQRVVESAMAAPPPPPPASGVPTAVAFAAASPGKQLLPRRKKKRARARGPTLDSPFFAGFVPRSPTGFVGCKNQGGTCYLNSFLQALYMDAELRNLVLQWSPPLPDATVRAPVMEALQRVFARLALSKMGAISLLPLCRAFGWDRASMFRQHDVQELYHALLAAMEREAPLGERGTSAPLCAALRRLFHGTAIDIIQCDACGASRERPAQFVDCSLAVRGKRHLCDALEAYTAPELLGGISCARCGGKRPASKKTTFVRLPEILIIHLKRFDWDWTAGRGRRVKIEDPIGLPERIDMKPYLTLRDRTRSCPKVMLTKNQRDRNIEYRRCFCTLDWPLQVITLRMFAHPPLRDRPLRDRPKKFLGIGANLTIT